MLNLTVFENGTERETIAVDRFPCLIGKHANNQIVLSGWTIGRVHAEIRATEQGFKLVDRGSLAGTWVNNERIVEFGPLSERDEIVIGSYRLRAQLPDDAAPTAPRAPAAAPAAAPRAEAAVRPAPRPRPLRPRPPSRRPRPPPPSRTSSWPNTWPPSTGANRFTSCCCRPSTCAGATSAACRTRRCAARPRR
ncbi:FHA domain-containing protein [Chitinimonas koreensis]|uniref:FHA domain-containing protein n=1 Tax=Chitinimonas koreensis TaxID=356302 RepID=UPI00223EC084|nr:FHA domain-containing protein [Chitinimonas koreensis]